MKTLNTAIETKTVLDTIKGKLAYNDGCRWLLITDDKVEVLAGQSWYSFEGGYDCVSRFDDEIILTHLKNCGNALLVYGLEVFVGEWGWEGEGFAESIDGVWYTDFGTAYVESQGDWVNLTQHNTSPEQKDDGDFMELTEFGKEYVKGALTFTSLPDAEEIKVRAEALASFAERSGAGVALIGGAPYLMGALEKALLEKGVVPAYSFSERVSVETVNADGEVVKTSKFMHTGWVWA